MKNKIYATIFAIFAAVLYAINMPCSKLLLEHIDPTMLASFLYLGVAFGIGILFLITHKKDKDYEKIFKKDIIYVIGTIVLDIAAPILLMFGLKMSPSSNASLLNNFEIVATALIALIIFKEKISLKMWIAIVLVTISSFFLSFESLSSFKFSWGSILVILATLCWGLENNCTRKLANKNTYQIVFLKGLFSGIGSLIIALILKESFPSFLYFALAILLGFVAYGLSIFFYIKAQKYLGAAKTSAYYAISPFIATFLSLIILKEAIDYSYFIGLGLMIVASIIIVLDTLTVKHCHQHVHTYKVMENGVEVIKTITHTHEHVHFANLNNHPYVIRHHIEKNFDEADKTQN